ncbi:hypothetical protein I4U23_003500 [Adineta vaga]|nr:hypothetical protein I4U23_003500 [Adineta vaga]
MLHLVHIILTFVLCTQEISASVICYNCYDHEYDFELTSDTIPDSLDGCTNFTGIRNCYVTISWRGGKSSLGTFHDIIDAPESKEMAFMAVLANNNQPQVTFRYLCSTDFCNTAINVKRAFNSATIQHSLTELVPQLNTTLIFNSSNCFNFQNGSVCSPSTGCQHCHITMRPNWKNLTSIEICARCDSAGSPYFEAMTYFDLIERKRFDDFDIRCLTSHCNSLENIELIRQKTNFQFDYNKYYGTNVAIVISSTTSLILLHVLLMLLK